MSDESWKTTRKQEGGISTTALEKTSTPENWQEIAALAYELWEARGRPDGSPDEDWFCAEREIANRNPTEQPIAEQADSTPPRFPVRSEIVQPEGSKNVRRASGEA